MFARLRRRLSLRQCNKLRQVLLELSFYSNNETSVSLQAIAAAKIKDGGSVWHSEVNDSRTYACVSLGLSLSYADIC
jgi:hypothetical protein